MSKEGKDLFEKLTWSLPASASCGEVSAPDEFKSLDPKEFTKEEDMIRQNLQN